MNLAAIDLNLLTAFEALSAERHVTRAARRLGISQPAMSDALRRLRKLFGDELFVRAAGAMQPTPRALALSSALAPVLAQLRHTMGDQVAFSPDATAKVFTLASTDYTSLVLLPPLMSRLRLTAPGLVLHIVGYEKGALGPMLDRGEIDLAVGVFPNPPEQAVRTVLFEEGFVGVARADHAALAAGPMSLATFAALPHALVSVNTDRRGVIDDRLQTLGLSRRIALVVPYMLLLPRVLAESELIAVLPRRAANAISDARLTTFALPVATDPWTVDLLWNPAARTDRATAWLRALIAETARAL
jgi:DNA-binding transcriptional LysR family regulator